jgi:hypothetical protein
VPKKILSDSTIRSVWPHLTNQRDYVAGALNKARLCNKENGNALVRIGVTGSGQKPCYRVSFRNLSGTEAIFGSYWDTHAPLDNEHAINTNWSTETMTYEEVHALMVEKHPTKNLG